MELQELKTKIVADGVVDQGEAAQLKEVIFKDGKIDREEADVLFQINNKVSGNKNHTDWDNVFIEGVSDHVLKDDTSPGVIDEAEADYLIKNIMSDGKVDDLEKRLLKNIKQKATSVHAKLQTKFSELGI